MIVTYVRGNPRDLQLDLLREAKNLNRNVVEAADEGLKGFLPKVAEVAPTYLPDRYAPLFTSDLKVQKFVHLVAAPSIRIRVYAHGVRGVRDVRSINAGHVRHPLFGNRDHWFSTRAKRGVVTTTFRRMRPEIVRAIDDELANVTRRVANG